MTNAPVPDLTSYVDGAFRLGSETSADTSPADPSELVATVSLAGSELASEAIAAATRAAASWAGTPATERGEILRQAAIRLDERAEDIGRDLAREEGKTLAEAVRETQLSARVLRYFAGQALDADGETYPSAQAGVLLFCRRGPIGVVSVITPWNFPISIPAWKIAPALVHGNTVVWKPAEITPLTATHLLRAFIDAGLPPGVLNLVVGRGSKVGEVLTTHPDVAAITFTGSTEVGRAIQARAAAAGKRVQLELGGKNPAVVLADANLDVAAAQISVAAFGGTGQKCTATSRVIVSRQILPGLVDRLVGHADGWRLGHPLDPQTTMGPLASEQALDEVLGQIDQARNLGARMVAGGVRPNGSLPKGYYLHPAVVVDARPDHPIVRDEVFGPVLVVLPVDSYAEAVTVANDTRYGLVASIFTADLATALRFTKECRAGIVKVNQGTSANEFHVPFGGVKDSGFGPREQGRASREFFTEQKTVYIAQP